MHKYFIAGVVSAVIFLSFSSQLVSKSIINQIDVEWVDWKDNYEKSYSDEEEAYRFAVFTNKYMKIKEHNAKDSKYKLGLNKFSDLTSQEMKALHHGYKSVLKGQNIPVYSHESIKVADKLDWRSKNAVTPVKDQGQCGSCWAFGTVGGIEGSYAIAKGNLTAFSEQQIVSCDTKDYGCNGGDLPTAYSYVNSNGLELESSYPYTSTDGSTGGCNINNGSSIILAGEVSGKKVTENSKDDFISALNKAPLSICIDAESSAFMDYSSGVIDKSSDCGTYLDHCVTAVGYDNTASEPYIIVKNSWGEGWGDKGYVLISIDSSDSQGVCGIYEEPYLAVINN